LGKIANYIFIKLQTFFDLVPESAAEHGNHGTLLQEATKSKKIGKKEVKPHSLFARTPINVNHTHRNRTVVACSSSKRSIKREMTWASQKTPTKYQTWGQ